MKDITQFQAFSFHIEAKGLVNLNKHVDRDADKPLLRVKQPQKVMVMLLPGVGVLKGQRFGERSRVCVWGGGAR